MEKPKKKSQPAERNEGRRKFLKGLGVATVTLAGIAVTKEGEAAPETSTAAPSTLPVLPAVQEGEESILLRMQRELQRALKKPLEDRRLGHGH